MQSNGGICGGGSLSWKPLRPKKAARHVFRESKFRARKHRPAVQETESSDRGVSHAKEVLVFAVGCPWVNSELWLLGIVAAGRCAHRHRRAEPVLCRS